MLDKTTKTQQEDGFQFSLTIDETKMVQNWAKTIGKSLTDDEHECFGGGIRYTFEPFIMGTCITVKYYGHELEVRVGTENDSVK